MILSVCVLTILWFYLQYFLYSTWTFPSTQTSFWNKWRSLMKCAIVRCEQCALTMWWPSHHNVVCSDMEPIHTNYQHTWSSHQISVCFYPQLQGILYTTPDVFHTESLPLIIHSSFLSGNGPDCVWHKPTWDPYQGPMCMDVEDVAWLLLCPSFCRRKCGPDQLCIHTVSQCLVVSALLRCPYSFFCFIFVLWMTLAQWKGLEAMLHFTWLGWWEYCR